MKTNSRFQHISAARLLIIFLLLASTSCGPGAGSLPSPTIAESTLPPTLPPPTETTAPSSTASPTATTAPTDTPIPSATSTQFVPSAILRIGVQVPLSGQYSEFGTAVLQSVQLAVSQMMEPLMEMGYLVEVVPYDDMSDTGTAIEKAKDIIADPQVQCVVGPFTSAIHNQVKEIYHQAGLAFISPSATAPEATYSGYPEVNRVLGRQDGEGISGARFAKEQGYYRLFVINQDVGFSEVTSVAFIQEARWWYLKIVGSRISADTQEFDSLISSVMETTPDLVVFYAMDTALAGEFFRQAREAGYTGAFMGNEGIFNSSILEAAGPLVTEGGGIYFTTISAPAYYYPGAAQFSQDYTQTYGTSPGQFTAQAYDAAGVCMKAMENAAQDGDLPTRDEVASGIRSLKDYPGITGTLNFDANGDLNPATYLVIQVTSPDPAKWELNPLVGTYQVPPPK